MSNNPIEILLIEDNPGDAGKMLLSPADVQKFILGFFAAFLETVVKIPDI